MITKLSKNNSNKTNKFFKFELGIRNALSYVLLGRARGFETKSAYEIFNSSVILQITYHCET